MVDKLYADGVIDCYGPAFSYVLHHLYHNNISVIISFARRHSYYLVSRIYIFRSIAFPAQSHHPKSPKTTNKSAGGCYVALWVGYDVVSLRMANSHKDRALLGI